MAHLKFCLAILLCGFAAASHGADATYLVIWPQPKSLCKQPLFIGLVPNRETNASDVAANLSKFDGGGEQTLWDALHDCDVTIVLDPRISELLQKHAASRKRMEFQSVPKDATFPLLSELTAYAGMIRQIVGREVCYEPLWMGTGNRRSRAIWPGKEPIQLALTFVTDEGIQNPEAPLIQAIQRYTGNRSEPTDAVQEMSRLWHFDRGPEQKASINLNARLRVFLFKAKKTEVERLAYELGAP